MSRDAEKCGSSQVARDKVRRIAETVAKAHADLVDNAARFPSESIAALRQERLLAAAIPVHLGGLGCSIEDIAAMCATLGEECASTAMVFAMHQSQVLCLVDHGSEDAAIQDFLALCAERQLLVASANSEEGTGGDLRSSKAAIELDGQSFRLEKKCTTVSYGEQADALLITAKRHPEAGPSDQCLVWVSTKDYVLERTGAWNTLGMRGTCSPGFKVFVRAGIEHIVDAPFRTIAAQTLTPTAHIFWSAVWLGIASAAFKKAQKLARRRTLSGSTISPLNQQLAAIAADLQALQCRVSEAVRDYEHFRAVDLSKLSTPAYALRINGLKLYSSQAVQDICLRSLPLIGITGYFNEGSSSLSRLLRDALSAPLMISNDRLRDINAELLLITGTDGSRS